MIQKILEENNYIPDENARSLVTQRTRMIGIVTDDLDSQHQNEAIAHCQNELIVNSVLRVILEKSRMLWERLLQN